MSCPHLLLLSQLADGELPAHESEWIEAHAGGCDLCTARLARLRQALGAAAAGAVRTEAWPATTRSPACLSPSELAGWRDPAVLLADRAAAARHLESCDPCLGDVLAAGRLLARLDATAPVPVPADLQARVAAAWSEPSAAEPVLSSLVVRVTRAGAELLESHLMAPLRELVQIATPTPALRAAAPAGTLSFRLEAPGAIVTATVEAAGDGVGLTLVIADDAGAGLADQRVSLRHHGRSIYSARTDATGTLRTPSLERGVYEVSCAGVGTSFRLDLRA